MGQTLIGLLQESVVKYASLAALKTRKPDDSFQTLTYAELYDCSEGAGHGSHRRRVLPGSARRHPRGKQPELARHGPGHPGLRRRRRAPEPPVPADQEIEHVIAHSDCEIAVVENAATLSRLLGMRKRLTRLRKIVVMEFNGTKPQAGMGEERVLIYTWEDVLKKGNRKIAKGERQFDLRAASVTAAGHGHAPVHLRAPRASPRA